MIPLRKYSYTYLEQLKFSSGAFILFVNVTTLRVKGMIWKGTHVLIKDLTANHAYQSKKQAPRSETGLRQATHLGRNSEKHSASLKGHRSM